jgi:PAS domain S-box-containing protein
MTRGSAGQAKQGAGPAERPAGYLSYLDPARAGDDRRALALLSAVLRAPAGWPLFITDPAGRVLAWSEPAGTLLGRPAEAVLGKLTWPEVVRPAGEAEPWREPLDAALRDGRWEGVIRAARPGGEPVSCQLTVTRLHGDDGQVIGALTVARDISGEPGGSGEPAAAPASTRAAFCASPVPQLSADLVGIITDLNAAAQALLGRTRGELAGTRLSTLFADIGQASKMIGEVLREGSVSNVELQVRQGGGSLATVSLSAAGFDGPDGKLAGLVASLTDLSERDQSRGRLLRAEAFSRGLIEAAPDGLAVVDPGGFITDANSPACELLGCRREQLAGSSLAELFAEPVEIAATVAAALAGQPLPGREFRLARASGQARQVLLTASVFHDPRSDGQRVIVSVHDVTEQAELRERLSGERAYNRGIIESSTNGLVMIDLRDRITDVNGTMCQLTGRDRKQLTGRDFGGLFTDPDTATAAVHRALAAGRPGTCELQLATGGKARVMVSASLVRRGSGEVSGVLASASDVSEPSRLRHDLTAEKAYNRAIIESAARAVFVLGPDGRISDVNGDALRLTGQPRGHLLSRPFARLFADPGLAREAVARAFREGSLADSQLSLDRPGQGTRIVAIGGKVFTDPRSGATALLAAARDVTTEKETEDRLYYYSKSLLGAIVDAFATTDALGVIQDVNEPMEALTGCSRDQLIGRHLEDYFTEPDRARELISAVLRNGKVTDYELTARTPGGATTVVSYSAATFTDSRGKLGGILATGRDVTDRKKSAELQAGLLRRARELDEAKNDFVSRISHELRSPLTNVLGYLELVVGDESGPLTRDQRRMLEVINRNGRRLLSLIDDLLLVSRIEAGQIAIESEPFRLDTLVRAVHESFRPEIASGDLTCRLDLEPGITIEADPAQLERVVTNLLSNAVKFTPPGGEIEVSARREKAEVVMTVRDTGIGVPEEEQPRLFTRFFRSSAAMERETQGTGLGLFIVKHVAEAHGGSVTVSSAPGSGSTFTIRLPSRGGSRDHATGREVPA